MLVLPELTATLMRGRVCDERSSPFQPTYDPENDLLDLKYRFDQKSKTHEYSMLGGVACRPGHSTEITFEEIGDRRGALRFEVEVMEE